MPRSKLKILVENILPKFLWNNARRLRAAIYQSRRRSYDRHFSVDTQGSVEISEMGINDKQRKSSNRYEATPHLVFLKMLRSFQIDYRRFTFVDIGSGKGAVLLYASEFPFRRIIGVEISATLNQIAAANIRKFRHNNMRCKDITTLCADGVTFPLPNDPLVLYLWNPFNNEMIEEMFSKIERSLKECPRQVIVMSLNPDVAVVLDKLHWLKRIGRGWNHSIYRNEYKRLPMNANSSISVIVPCRNEKEHIENTIRSILAQEPTLGGFEIIVADGMSDDGTRSILKSLTQQDPRVRIIDNPGKITPCGMNAGIREARGRYIAIMGAHNQYAPDYLAQGLEVLKTTGADNVGGIMTCEAKSYAQKAIAAAHHSAFSVGGARWHNTSYEGPADTVFGGFYRREVFDRIGFFDEELVRNQDDELNLRLVRAGGKIWQSPRMRSWYNPRASLRDLCRQYTQYGYWKVRVIQKHRMPASLRQVVPGTFVLALILLAIASPWWSPGAWALGGILGAHLACNLSASFLAAGRRGWTLLPFLPLVFACYHFAYGYGFLRGILDFVILRRAPRRIYTQLSRTNVNRRL